MDRYAVIGHPVDHSLSPWIHARFADQTGQDMRYDRIDPGAEGFRAAVEFFFAEGGRGLNVTVPFKAEARDCCSRLSGHARRAGVVNTLHRTDRGVEGHNTDGVGLVRDLRHNQGIELAGTRILLVGAGGAARGILGPLLDEQPAVIVVVNRTPERARALAGEFAADGPVRGGGFDMLADGDRFDVVVNASAASLGDALPALPESAVVGAEMVHDLMYGPPALPFLRWARDAGARRTADGLGMLVEQAAESFRIWRGVRPDTAPVIAALIRA